MFKGELKNYLFYIIFQSIWFIIKTITNLALEKNRGGFQRARKINERLPLGSRWHRTYNSEVNWKEN